MSSSTAGGAAFWLFAIGTPVVLVSGALILLRFGPPVLRRPRVAMGLNLVAVVGLLVEAAIEFFGEPKHIGAAIGDVALALLFGFAAFRARRAMKST